CETLPAPAAWEVFASVPTNHNVPNETSAVQTFKLSVSRLSSAKRVCFGVVTVNSVGWSSEIAVTKSALIINLTKIPQVPPNITVSISAINSSAVQLLWKPHSSEYELWGISHYQDCLGEKNDSPLTEITFAFKAYDSRYKDEGETTLCMDLLFQV
ncbi:hypothetical protein EG68_02149, partial [Paragonimus skrjabini miyazakii]